MWLYGASLIDETNNSTLLFAFALQRCVMTVLSRTHPSAYSYDDSRWLSLQYLRHRWSNLRRAFPPKVILKREAPILISFAIGTSKQLLHISKLPQHLPHKHSINAMSSSAAASSSSPKGGSSSSAASSGGSSSAAAASSGKCVSRTICINSDIVAYGTIGWTLM